MVKVILLSLFLFTSCDQKPEILNARNVSSTQSLMSGVDMFGKERSCVDQYDNLACTSEFQDSDKFALNCERDGFFAVQCGCHDWICSQE